MDFPVQEPSKAVNSRCMQTGDAGNGGEFDMRDWLDPRRVTVVMWDFTFLTRHVKGGSFEDYDRVLDEVADRGYNTLRLDPLPHVVDLAKPDTIYSRPANVKQPLIPWDGPHAFEGPVGKWLIEFMEKVLKKGLYYCLSAWSYTFDQGVRPQNLRDITECWKVQLREWKKRFGFQNCIYVDLSNEYPYFLNGHLERTIEEYNGRWSPEWNRNINQEVNSCLREMREEFPELRFMVSVHGDVKWIDVDLELDAMDIHFYADADPRFCGRTLFDKNYDEYFRDESLFKDFSNRCMASHKAMAPMYRARQRSKLAAFANWSQTSGIPLITTESWASWYYIDHRDLDWSWLLEWAEWSVEDAIDHKMWGWTPHNYCQPQFENWKDVRWHRRLTDRFLRS